MANFPTSLPSITNPTANDTLAAVPHHEQHEHANDEIAAIAAKVGTGASTPTENKLLVGSGTGTSAWSDTIGSGDPQYLYTNYDARLLSARVGTAGSPDTTPGAVVRIERKSQVDDSLLTGDGAEELAALSVTHKGTASSPHQPVAVLGQAEASGTQNGAGGRMPDATAGYFRGVVSGSGTGGGIGIFAGGNTTSAYGKATGAEIYVYNGTGTDHSVNPSGAPTTCGIWMNANGGRVAVAFNIGHGFGEQFETGFHANAGSILNATFRDDSDAVDSIRILGSHTYAYRDYSTSTASIRLDGSYTVGIDLSGGTFGSGAIFLGNGSTKGIIMRNAAGNAAHRVLDYDASDVLHIGTGVGSNIYSAVLHIFGGGINVSARNIATDTTTGTKIGTSTSQKLGFFGATPIAKPTGVAVSAAGIHAALVSLGLIAA